MESNSGQIIFAVQSRLKALLMEGPPEGVSWAEWQERVQAEICGPLELVSGKLIEQQQQFDFLQGSHRELVAENARLRAENARLRARLEGHHALESTAFERAEAFRSLADDSPDIIIRLDRDLRHVYVNPAFTQLTGLPPDAFLGRSVDEVGIYQPLQKDLALWAAPLLEGKEMRLEVEIPIQNQPHWFDLRMVPEFDPQGEVESILVDARDMTHYKLVECALRRSEERFSMAASLAGLTLFEQDPSLVYTWRHSPDTLNDLQNPMLGKRDSDLYLPETAQMLDILKRGVLESGQRLHQELLFHTQDGLHWRDTIFEPLRDAKGAVTGLLGCSVDVTERKRMEANQRFLKDLGRELVSMVTADDVLNGASSRVGEFLGVSRCFVSLENLERREHVVRLDYASGVPAISGTFPLDENLGLLYEHLGQGRVLVIPDLAHDPLTARKYQTSFAPSQMAALVVAPMLDRKGHWNESLTVSSQAPRVWRPDEVALILGAADLVHLALESARLFEDLQGFRSRFDIALRNSPITVYTTDRDQRLNWIYNPLHGFTTEQVAGGMPEDQTLDSLSLGNLAEALRAMQQSVLESGQGLRRELHLTVNGEMISNDVTVEPLRGAQGEILGLTVAVLENTELRRFEVEASRSQARIEIQRRLIAEREMERTRIARDLHDGPLQDMIAATYALVDAMTINDKAPRLEKMHEIQEMLKKQVQHLRRFCNDLRPPVLAPFGLEKTIRSHVDGLQSLYPELEFSLEMQPDGQRLPEEIRMTLFRIYQELMNNVIRHAHASAVKVGFHMDDHRAELSVEDNGKGFSTASGGLEDSHKSHLGLMGVQERVETAGGEMRIHSAPGAGTRVTVLLPLG